LDYLISLSSQISIFSCQCPPKPLASYISWVVVVGGERDTRTFVASFSRFLFLDYLISSMGVLVVCSCCSFSFFFLFLLLYFSLCLMFFLLFCIDLLCFLQICLLWGCLCQVFSTRKIHVQCLNGLWIIWIMIRFVLFDLFVKLLIKLSWY
jgi:hypothetical protein